MKLFKWIKGRHHNCKYEKFTLWYFKIFNLGFDGYILKYENGTTLDWHKDVVEGYAHWRLNITLKGFSSFFTRLSKGKNEYGGYSNVVLFRPDILEHKLDVHKETIKLSFGFIKKK